MSHHGYPTVVDTVRTGNCGRPRINIDPDFLQWAYAHRSTSGICRFLHVGHNVVRNALLEYGIAQPQENPFLRPSEVNTTHVLPDDDLLDPSPPLPNNLAPDILGTSSALSSTSGSTIPTLVSFTGPLSMLSDSELDNLICQLHSHFRRAGISMLDGMLRRLGHQLPRE